MANEVSNVFANLPAHVKNAKSAAMQAMAGGMAGGGFGNRISIKGSRFRLIQNGTPLGALASPTLDVVVFTMANSVQRFYFEGAYEEGSKERPTCFSHDGKTPSAESPKLQSNTCALCPQNVKGSGRQGNTKACAYKKRVIVLAPDDLEGAAYALDVNGQSMFGEQQESQNKFSFKGYFEKLTAHSVDIAAIVTRLSFDDDASVPKLHFSPIRVLTEAEYEAVQKRLDDDEVQKMLKDLTNEAEMETEPKATPKAVPVQQAPEPVAPKALEKKGVGGLTTTPKKGFGATIAEQPAAAAAPAVPAGNGKAAKPLTIDLDSLTSFDD